MTVYCIEYFPNNRTWTVSELLESDWPLYEVTSWEDEDHYETGYDVNIPVTELRTTMEACLTAGKEIILDHLENRRTPVEMDPRNFAQWTSINLGHCTDFIKSIIGIHGDLRGDYDSLIEIGKALEKNIAYAVKVQAYWEKKNNADNI